MIIEMCTKEYETTTLFSCPAPLGGTFVSVGVRAMMGGNICDARKLDPRAAGSYKSHVHHYKGLAAHSRKWRAGCSNVKFPLLGLVARRGLGDLSDRHNNHCELEWRNRQISERQRLSNRLCVPFSVAVGTTDSLREFLLTKATGYWHNYAVF